MKQIILLIAGELVADRRFHILIRLPFSRSYNSNEIEVEYPIEQKAINHK